jgi:hypothetical protein
MFVVKKLLMHVCVAVCSSDEDKLPSVSFEMKGGAAYDVFSPILVFDTSDVYTYLLISSFYHIYYI